MLLNFYLIFTKNISNERELKITYYIGLSVNSFYLVY